MRDSLTCGPCTRQIRAATLLAKVRHATGDCHEWSGQRNRDGYGVQCHTLAHRAVWTLHRGAIPTRMVIMHTCDNPACCNLDHLRLGTQAENMRDMARKDRAGRRAPQGEAHGAAKITSEVVRAMRASYADGETQVAIARAYSVSRSLVQAAVSGRTWRCVT